MENQFNKENHKQEILKSRVGGFGSSDAEMFARIAQNGINNLSLADMKRICIAKGYLEPENFTTQAMENGHIFEEFIYNTPKFDKLQREYKILDCTSYNFEMYTHIDIWDPTNRRAYELKATKDFKDIDKIKDKYKYQITWHYMMGAHLVWLVVGDNKDKYDLLDDPYEMVMVYFDHKTKQEILEGLDQLNKVWDDNYFNAKLNNFAATYKEGGLLSLNRDEMALFQSFEESLILMKELENKIARAKETILQNMKEKGLFQLKSDKVRVDYIAESTRTTFDKKALQLAHPEINLKEFEKQTKVSESVRITLI